MSKIVAGLASFPDDGYVVTVFLSPGLRSLLELRSRHVRPQGAPDVFGVDDDVRHPGVVASWISCGGFRAVMVRSSARFNPATFAVPARVTR